MKPESGSLPDAEHSPSDIPLIILTEPSQPPELSHQSNSGPTSPSKNTSLPLTKDILRRKDKLDRLLTQNDRFNRLSLDYSTSSAVDERVTAGLGISTSNDTPSGLRSRRRSSARPSSLAIPSTSYNNTNYSSPIQSESQWSFDLGTYGTTKSGSSQDNPKTASSTKSGSSARNSASMQPYSAYHQHQHHHYIRKEEYQRINQHIDKGDVKSENYILNILFNTANRVVSARAPESKQMASTETFDFDQPLDDDIPLQPVSISKLSMEKDDTTLRKSSLGDTHSKRHSWLSISVGRRSSTTSERDEALSIIDRRFSIRPSGSLNIDLLTAEDAIPNPLQGYSLGFFGPNSRLRICALRFIRKRWVESWMFFLMILHWFLLACVPIEENQQKSILNGQWNHYPVMFIQCLYTIEFLCKICAYGLVLPPHTQLRHIFGPHEIKPEKRNHKACLNSFGNILDVISLLSYWADVVLMTYRYPNLSLFKSLGALRPIRLLSIFPGTAVILKSLETSWDLLLAVTGLILFFLILFALLGLISFQGVFSRRCYFPGNDGALQLVEPAKFCSGYYNGTTLLGPQSFELSSTDYPSSLGYLCKHGQICIEDSGNNPHYGYVNFDNIFSAFLNVFTFVSLELWTDQMYQTQEGSSSVAALYYCLGVYIVAFILTFLLFAVITSAFARVRAVNAVSAFTAKKKGYSVLRDEGGILWMFEDDKKEARNASVGVRTKIFLKRMVMSRSFFYFGGFLVLLDMIFMCLRSFEASQEILELVDDAETGFTFIFATEIIIRMAGATSWTSFWLSRRNVFDLFIVITTCVIQLPDIQYSSCYKYLTIFQILRLYRLFICIPRVRRLLRSAFGNGENICYVVVFLILATALCSTIFMQMFGGDYENILADDEPGNRFNTFWEAFVSLIVVYTSETWTELLYDAMASQTGQGSIYAAVALSIYFAFGRYIMSGLYIAVVLENFELSDDYIRHYQIKDFINRHRFKDRGRTETILYELFRPLYKVHDKKSIQVASLPAHLSLPLSTADITELLSGVPFRRRIDQVTKPSIIEKKILQLAAKIRKKLPFFKKKISIKDEPIYIMMNDLDDAPDDYEIIAAEENRSAEEESVPIANSLFIFSNQSRIRYYCKRLVGSNHEGQAEKHNLFNWLVMTCVLVSIVMVILDEPSTRLMRRDTVTQFAYDTIEQTLSVLFVVELIIRIVADGLLLTPTAYLRNHWNQLDFCVIIINIVTIFMGSDESPRGLSTVRSLRILRLIRYFNGVRDIFVALFYAFPMMMDALIFTFLVLIPFSIYGINIFGGLMWLCNDDSVASRGECVGEYLYNISEDDDVTVNILVPRMWQNPELDFYSFDNFPVALQHLFSMTSTEGWVDSMFSAMSTPPEPDIQPQFSWDSKVVYHGIFYILFMIISQGTMQLFVGVIIEKFKERSGITTLTTAQRQFADLQRMLASVRPTIKVYEPTSRFRRLCYRMVIKKRGKFNKIMMFIIVLNIMVLSSEFQASPQWLSDLQDYSYLVFTVIYVLESIIKVMGLGWKKWTRSRWNWFDGLLAWSAFFLMILRFALPGLWTLRAERYCLIFEAFRLGEGIDALQTLYHTIAKSMPSIIQVSAVFMVVMCLFAMIFMEFFGLTKYGVYGHAHANFRDYGNALLFLVRFTTGEAWNAIIVDYAVQTPNCNNTGNYLQNDCGSPFWAYVLFDLFYIICTHIFLNLFTAVIISKFEYTYETRTRFTSITKTDLRMFKYAWAEIDTKGTGFIQKDDIAKFLRQLKGRFKFQIYEDIHDYENLLRLSRKKKHPVSPKDDNLGSEILNNIHYNLYEVNKCLSEMDIETVRQRRYEYNICFQEILMTETAKGISFAGVLTILSYRFVNINESLTLEPLIKRLEKLDQIKQEYHLQKAAGFFLAQVQRRRFIRDLWKKRDEDEVKKLGITSNAYQLSAPSPGSNGWKYVPKHRKKPMIDVPSIIISSDPPHTAHSSPTTPGSYSMPASPYFSLDAHYDSSLIGDNLSILPNSSLSSPLEYDNRSSHSGGLSPYSPTPSASPTSRQNWQLIDGNMEMPFDISESLVALMSHSVWSSMLQEEDM